MVFMVYDGHEIYASCLRPNAEEFEDGLEDEPDKAAEASDFFMGNGRDFTRDWDFMCFMGFQ